MRVYSQPLIWDRRTGMGVRLWAARSMTQPPAIFPPGNSQTPCPSLKGGIRSARDLITAGGCSDEISLLTSSVISPMGMTPLLTTTMVARRHRAIAERVMRLRISCLVTIAEPLRSSQVPALQRRTRRNPLAISINTSSCILRRLFRTIGRRPAA